MKLIKADDLVAYINSHTNNNGNVKAPKLLSWVSANAYEATVTPPVDPPPATGFPDATNTGIPAGTVLKRVPQDLTSGPGWEWDTRGWISVNVAGTVLDAIDVKAEVSVMADNVTVRRCKIVHGVEGASGVASRHAHGTIVEDCEIHGVDAGMGRLMRAIADVYGDGTGLICRRNNISMVGTGIQCGHGTLEDNFIHDMGYKDGDHTNCQTSNRSDGPLIIRHNTHFCQLGQTDAVSLFQDFGPQHDVTIDNNLLAGGSYTIYGGASSKPEAVPTTNIKITNNRISRKFFPNGGQYGPVAYFEKDGVGNVWSGNVWDDTGEAIVAPATFGTTQEKQTLLNRKVKHGDEH
jgi:hypothetical protein